MAKQKYQAGFYWIICKPGGRWEVGEFDGVCWLAGPDGGGDNHFIGERITEPTEFSNEAER